VTICSWCDHDSGWHRGGVRCSFPGCACLRGGVKTDADLTDIERRVLALFDDGPLNTDQVRKRLGWGAGAATGKSPARELLDELAVHGRVRAVGVGSVKRWERVEI
jgi:hypothetical protein